MKKYKINAAEKVTRGDIEIILTYLYGERISEANALKFLKEVEGCKLENVVNKSPKPIYTVPKNNFWNHLFTIPSLKKLLDKRNIRSYQQLNDRADSYYVQHYYD